MSAMIQRSCASVNAYAKRTSTAVRGTSGVVAHRPAVTSNKALRRLAPSSRGLRSTRRPQRTAIAVAAEYPTQLPAAPTAGMVAIKFQLPYKTNIGESFSIVGDSPELGEWSTEGALTLEWSEGHVWCGGITLPAGTEAEFKCVLHGADGAETWQIGDNRKLIVPSTSSAVEVNLMWDIEAVTVHPLESLGEEAQVHVKTPYFHPDGPQGPVSYSEDMSSTYDSQEDAELEKAKHTLVESADKIEGLQRMVDDLRQNHLALQEEWEASGGQLTSDLYQQLMAAEQGLMEEARQLNGFSHDAAVGSEHMELARVKSEFSAAKGDLADAHAQIASLRNELTNVAQSYNERMQQTEAEMQQRMAQFQQEANTEIERLHRALSETQQGGSMGSQDGDVETLRQELAAAQAQLAQAKQLQTGAAQEAEAAVQQARELQERLQAAESEIHSLRAWIDQNIEAQAAAPAQQPAAEDSGELQQRLASMQQQIEQQQTAFAERDAIIEDLQKQLSGAQYYLKQAQEGHAAAHQAAEAAIQREYALYEQLQAAQAEIVSLRQWIDQAMEQRRQ